MSRQVNNIFMLFSAVTVSASFFLQSCRTTSPSATALKSSDEQSHGSSVAPKQEIQEILRWVVATRKETAGGSGDSTWNIDLKTDPEVWCEARCSKFELLEKKEGEVSELRVKKTTVAGNTSPGMLDVSKEFKINSDKSSKVRLLNVGIKGQTVVLEDVVTKDRPNFYAVPMKITPRGDAAKAVVTADFMGKPLEVRMDKDQSLPTVLTRGTAPVESFVMGSLVDEKDSSGKVSQVFWATKILPMAEE